MDATLDLLLDEFCRPAFNIIDAERECWREVDVMTRTPRQPSFHSRCFVCAAVVHDDADLEMARNMAVDPLQKAEELGSLMMSAAFADDEG